MSTMIPITALLNELDDRTYELERAYSAQAKLQPQSPSTASDSSEEMSPVLPQSQFQGQHQAVESPHDRDSLSESASLLGALTLQALRYSESGTYCDPDVADKESAERAVASATASSSPNANANASPRTPRRPRRSSSQDALTPTSEEDRRAKQRMIVKRCYYKKIQTINELREHVQQLEQAFQVLLEYEMKREIAKDEAGDIQNQEDDVVKRAIQARRQWIEMLTDKEALRHENQRLRKLADEHYMKNQSRLRALLDANRKDIKLFTPAQSQ